MRKFKPSYLYDWCGVILILRLITTDYALGILELEKTFIDARKVMDAWKRSSGHNRNLLTANVCTFFEIFIFSNLLP